MQRAVHAFPSLRDKCAVRLVSRLNEAKEQTRVQAESEGFWGEMISFLTGESARRQNRINASVTDVVEQTVEDLSQVMESQAFTSRTLGLVHDELRNVQRHTEVIGLEVLGLKDRFTNLEVRVNERFSELTAALAQVDLRQRAFQHMERVIWRWKGGALGTLPILLRCYSVLEDLWWGDFGFYIQRYPGQDSDQLLEDLRLRVTSCLSDDMKTLPRQRVPREIWLQGSVGVDRERDSWVWRSAALLSDWSKPEIAPYVSLLCNTSVVDQEVLVVPHLLSAERLGREFTKEFFVDREFA